MAFRREAHDLRLLRGELVECVHGSFAGTLACRQQLAFGAARVRLGAHPGERLKCGAQMLSGVLMLRHLDERDAADRLEGAIAAVIAEGESVTYDMKPNRDDPTAVGTSEVADAVIEKLEAEVPA